MSKYVGLRVGITRETHVVSEYYCGGCGWPVTDHDSFCPECGGALHPRYDADYPELKQIVRCKDCKCSTDSPAWPGAMECYYIGRGVEPESFCAWGERRDA